MFCFLITKAFNSQDLIVNSPLYLIHISLLISYENLVLDQVSRVREKFHVDHFWELKG